MDFNTLLTSLSFAGVYLGVFSVVFYNIENEECVVYSIAEIPGCFNCVFDTFIVYIISKRIVIYVESEVSIYE